MRSPSANGALTALNIKDARDPGAAHGIGAWVLRGGAPTWTVFLPNAVMAAGTRAAQPQAAAAAANTQKR